MSDQVNPTQNDDIDDFADVDVVCPYCGEQTAIEYVGEAYDDEAHIGSSYNCLECGHKFSDADAHLW